MSNNLEVMLTDTQINNLVDLYIQECVSPESFELYNESIDEGKTIDHALKIAIVNESANRILRKAMEKQEL